MTVIDDWQSLSLYWRSEKITVFSYKLALLLFALCKHVFVKYVFSGVISYFQVDLIDFKLFLRHQLGKLWNKLDLFASFHIELHRRLSLKNVFRTDHHLRMNLTCRRQRLKWGWTHWLVKNCAFTNNHNLRLLHIVAFLKRFLMLPRAILFILRGRCFQAFTQSAQVTSRYYHFFPFIPF